MIAKIVGIVVLTLAGLVALALLAGFPTMWLWNWLMPTLFSVKAVTFWQAVGINIFTGILFKTTSVSK